MQLFNIILAVVVVSLISLIGVLYFWTKAKTLQRWLPWLVAFAAGMMLAVSFFDLLPESFEHIGAQASYWIAVGVLGFLLFERLIHWHHSHQGDCCEDSSHRAVGYSVLLGDGLHNFLDGVLIASAFAVNPAIGWTTTVAIIAHEIPQELSDYAVLLHAGFKPNVALWFNLLSALTAVAGGLVGFWFIESFAGIEAIMTAIGAGGFIYIALVDLLAEMKTRTNSKLAWWGEFALVVLAIVVFVAIKQGLGLEH